MPRLEQRLSNLAIRKIEYAEDSLFVPSALKPKNRLHRLDERKIPFHQGFIPFSPVYQPAERLKNRVRIFFLLIHSKCKVRFRHRQPWLGGTEPAVRLMCGPWHRRPTSVPSFEIGPELNPPGIFQIFESDFRFCQAELFAFVDTCPAPKCEQRRKKQFCQTPIVPAEFRLLHRPGDSADIIVVAHCPCDPASSQSRFGPLNNLNQRRCGERLMHEFEVITAVQ